MNLSSETENNSKGESIENMTALASAECAFRICVDYMTEPIVDECSISHILTVESLLEVANHPSFTFDQSNPNPSYVCPFNINYGFIILSFGTVGCLL